MTKIAFINNYPGPALGGGETQLLTLLRGLSVEQDMEPVVVCASGSALEVEAAACAGVQVISVDFGLRSLPSLVARLAARMQHSDIVQGTGYLTRLVARQVGHKLGAAVIDQVSVIPGAARLDGEWRAVSLARDLLERRSRAKVTHFVAVSHAVEAALLDAGVPKSYVTVLPIGVDIAGVRSSASSSPVPLSPATSARVGFVGRLEPVKGCEYFVRAAAVLAPEHPDVGFVVAGAGSLLPALRGLAARLAVAERIEFLGYVASAPPLLNTLDVLVVPSLSEAAGSIAVEALALGVPVIASRVGGLPDIVVHEETGLLVEPGDAPGIAVAVERLLSNRAWARELGSRGATHVEAQFSAPKMIESYLRLYRTLSQSRHA